MNIVKKYDEMSKFEVIEMINAILSDELAVKDMYVREIYKQIYLLNFWSDFDFADCKDNNKLDMEKALVFVKENPVKFKEFEKAFGKTNLRRFEEKLEKRSYEMLYELNSTLSQEIDEKMELIQSTIESATTMLQGFMQNDEQKELLNKLVEYSSKEELTKLAREQVKDELAKKKAEKNAKN